MIGTEQVSQLRIMIQHTGWNEVLEPWLKQKGQMLIRQLLTTPTRRLKPYDEMSDDELRGRVAQLEEVLVWVANQLKVDDHNRVVDELHTHANGPADTSMANP